MLQTPLDNMFADYQPDDHQNTSMKQKLNREHGMEMYHLRDTVFARDYWGPDK